MNKWLENSDHPLSECGVLVAELFMESLSPPENLNILCAQFSGAGAVFSDKNMATEHISPQVPFRIYPLLEHRWTVQN